MNIYLSILLMAGITYMIRVLPLTLIRKDIKNPTIRSFLYYVPYVTLSVMTFPAIIEATATPWAGAAAMAIALLLSFLGCKLFSVSVVACFAAFLIEVLL